MPSPGGRAALALVTLLAGCAGFAPTATPSPTVTPAPVPTPAPATTPAPFNATTTYPIGPVEPTCPAGPDSSEQRYPPVFTRNVTVNGTWAGGADAAVLAERAALGTEFDPRSPLFPATKSHERIRIAGETFDPQERFDIDRFAIVAAVENPTFHALVLPPNDGRTRVVLHRTTSLC